MGFFLLIAFSFFAVIFVFPLFWQAKLPSREKVLMFLWEAANLLILAGFLTAFFRLSRMSLPLLAILVLSVLARRIVLKVRAEGRETGTFQTAANK